MNPTNTKLEESINYESISIMKKRWILAGFLSVFLAFMLYFPFMLKFESVLRAALLSSPSCAISYEKIDYSLFLLPKAVIKNVSIPGSCLGSKNSLPIDEIALNFRLFALDPFGLHFNIDIKALDTNLDGNLTYGLFGHALNINRNSLAFEKLSPYMPSLPKIKGDIELNLSTKFTNEDIKDLKLNINSKNIKLPPQKVSIIDLPLLDIKNLFILLKSQKNGTIKVEKLILGDVDSPIRANFTGTIKPNMRAIGYSDTNLKGELAFSDSFIKEFSIIKGLMSPYTQKDGFYQIGLSGPLANIKPRKR